MYNLLSLEASDVLDYNLW